MFKGYCIIARSKKFQRIQKFFKQFYEPEFLLGLTSNVCAFSVCFLKACGP